MSNMTSPLSKLHGNSTTPDPLPSRAPMYQLTLPALRQLFVVDGAAQRRNSVSLSSIIYSRIRDPSTAVCNAIIRYCFCIKSHFLICKCIIFIHLISSQCNHPDSKRQLQLNPAGDTRLLLQVQRSEAAADSVKRHHDSTVGTSTCQSSRTLI